MYIYIHTHNIVYIYDNVCMSSLYEVLCRSGVGVSELKGFEASGDVGCMVYSWLLQILHIFMYILI